jgi:hypothetical protein
MREAESGIAAAAAGELALNTGKSPMAPACTFKL